MATEKPVHLTYKEGEKLLEPFESMYLTDVIDSDATIDAIRKLRQHAASFEGDEELAPIGERIAAAGAENDLMWFALLCDDQELPITGEEPLLNIVHQHAQNALSSLNESVRHAHEGNRERVLADAAVLGLFAREIALKVRAMEEWPPPRPAARAA